MATSPKIEVPFDFGAASGNDGRFGVPAVLFAILGMAARAILDGDFASSSASVTRKLYGDNNE